MDEEMVKKLERFGEVQVESEWRVIVKTEPFHTLVTKYDTGYVVYAPTGVYTARDAREVIMSLEGRKKPDEVVYPQIVPFLEALETEVKLFVNRSIIARVPEIGRDLYIIVPAVLVTGENRPGTMLLLSTRIGENEVLNEAVKIPYSSYDDAVRKLASLIVAINHGDIRKIYETRMVLQ